MSAITPTLEPFITPEELRAALGEPDLEGEAAEWLCDWGSAAVRAEVGQMINVVEGDTVVLDGTGSPLILLPELEVREVEAVALVGLEGEDVEADVRYTWAASGCLWRLRGGAWRYRPGSGWRRQLARWSAWPRSVAVTYSHGWASPSPQWEAARQVALEVAARTFRNPGMLQSERIGDYSRAWVPRGGRAELTPAEQRSLDILRPGR